MTPQEEQLLNSLVQRVNTTQLQEKDPDAEALLNRSLASNPDAIYILAQTVLVQNIAIEQAKSQVAQLQQQLQQAKQQPAHATSFLGSLLGHRDPEPPSAPPPVRTIYAEPPYQPVQQGPYQPVAQNQYIPAAQPQFVSAGAGGSSFLRGAMQTAAGVAAGALAFEGVESVLHGLTGHPSYGWDGSAMGAGFERPVEETVVNNYYDQPAGQSNEEHRFHESAEQGSGAQLSDASYNSSGADRGAFDTSSDNSAVNDDSGDNSGFDNSGGDDSGSFDDGSASFDDGGSSDGGGDQF